MAKDSNTSSEPVVEKKVIKNFLQEKTIKVLPIEGGAKWSGLLANPDKVKNQPFLFDKAKRSYRAPLRPKYKGGGITPVLDNTKAIYTSRYPEEKLTEQQFFERVLDLELYPTSEFWRKHQKASIEIGKRGRDLDLSNPWDYIAYKILLTNKSKVAQSYESRFDRASYQLYMVDAGEKINKEAEAAELKIRAYGKLEELVNSVEKMKDFLSVSGLSVPANADEKFLKVECLKRAENPKEFLDILEDEFYEDKLFIAKAVKAGSLRRISPERYALDNGAEIGDTVNVIRYFRDPKNSEMKIRTQTQVRNYFN